MNPELHKIFEGLGGQRRMDYSLDRLRSALSELGNPQLQTPAILVGGTNGKGTTALLLSSVLREAGHQVVTYLSPHLEHPKERFLLGLSSIAENELLDLAKDYEPLAQRFELTYFEYQTLLFFEWAKLKAADFQVVEVGLGGTLDATNLCNPIASVLTNVALDHQDVLGSTKEQILKDKMGIFRSEGLVFTGIEEPELLKPLEERCLELDAIHYLSKELRVETGELSWRSQVIRINGFEFELSNPSSGMVKNAALAFLTARIVFPKLAIETIQRAFARVRIPGRFEVVQENPRVILSADHNPEGIRSLFATLKRLEPSRLRVVCGFSPSKPHQEMFEALSQRADHITLTEIDEFRGKMPKEYFELAQVEPDAFKAIDEQLETASPEDTLLITGSIYLLGEVRRRWHPEVTFLKETLKPILAVGSSRYI